MKQIVPWAALALVTLCPLARAEESSAQPDKQAVAPAVTAPVIRLWPIEMVGGEENRLKEEYRARGGRKQISGIKDPNLTVYQVKSSRPTPAVVYCPGGAYSVLDPQPELVQWLNEQGVTVFMLKYTIPGKREAAFADVQRALRLVRHQATTWNVDPDKLGVVGQSAGGHLIARLSQNYQQPAYEPIDDADRQGCAPKFAIVISGAYFFGPANQGPQLAEEFHMKNKVAPTFFVYAKDDKWCPGGIAYEAALKAAGFSTRIQLYEKGGHGLAGVDWYPVCGEWLAQGKLLGR